MKQIYLAILSFVLLYGTAQAQKNFKPAVLIKAAGDTVKGYINLKEWDKSPKSIEFKALANDGKFEVYTPAMLQGFDVLGATKYRSYNGSISADKNVFPNLPASLDTATVRSSIFLQQSYSGKFLSMLVHTDAEKERIFVMETGKEPVELKYHQYYVNNNNIQEARFFQNQLALLAAQYNPNDQNIGQAIGEAKYSPDAIMSVLKKINSDQSKGTSSNGGSRFYAGVTLNRTVGNLEGYILDLSGKKPSNINPSLNAGYDLFLNKYTQTLFFRADLSLSMNSPHFKYGSKSNYIYDLQYKQYTASLTPQVVWSFYNKGAFKIYIDFGFGFNYSTYSDDDYIFGTGNDLKSYKNKYVLRKSWVSKVFKAGVFVNKKVEIYAQYIPSTAYVTHNDFDVRNVTQGIGVHYLFGTN
jgi:hypothetical protein